MPTVTPERTEIAERVMRSNPTDPTRTICRDCRGTVLKVFLPGGRALLVDHPELTLPAGEASPADLPTGLVVAVDAAGNARPLRLPSERWVSGEALYAVHELTCGSRA